VADRRRAPTPGEHDAVEDDMRIIDSTESHRLGAGDHRRGARPLA
jgi:hypothetical protein